MRSVYITGKRAVETYLVDPGVRERVVCLYVTDPHHHHRFLSLAREAGIRSEVCSAQELSRYVGSHRGFALEVLRTFKEATLEDLCERAEENALLVALDHLQDPHNVGAILRSADQFGALGVILPERRAVKDAATISKSSSGADAFVPVVVETNLRRALLRVKEAGFWVYGADMEGQPVHEVDLSGRVCLVLGAEGKGLSRLLREEVDLLVTIPARGHVDSFNVSVAAGILMYEVRRQQGWF